MPRLYTFTGKSATLALTDTTAAVKLVLSPGSSPNAPSGARDLPAQLLSMRFTSNQSNTVASFALVQYDSGGAVKIGDPVMFTVTSTTKRADAAGTGGDFLCSGTNDDGVSWSKADLLGWGEAVTVNSTGLKRPGQVDLYLVYVSDTGTAATISAYVADTRCV